VALNGEGSWAKILKWKFAAFFAFHRNQDIPERPNLIFPKEGKGRQKEKVSKFWDPDCLLCGWVNDQLQKLKSSLDKGDRQMFWQIVNTSQQLKKAMPPVPQSMVDKSVEDTVVELTLNPLALKQVKDSKLIIQQASQFFGDFLPGSEFYSLVTKEKVVDALKRSTSELFQFEKLTFDDLFDPFFPSTSANYIWSRGKCGSLNELYQKSSFGKEGSKILFGEESCLLSEPVSSHFGELGKHEQYTLSMQEQLGYGPTETGTVLRADISELKDCWKQQFCRLFELALLERPLVSPVGLSEPLKVRVISKGPPLLYSVLKPIQKWLWRTLKQHRVFNLIGRYVTEDDVNRILGNLGEEDLALSGDYISSTNKIHSWVSEVILDQLMLDLGENIDKRILDLIPNFMSKLKEMMLRALTKHIFVDEAGNELPQTEGQLMGSIVSFPFLCIANAALCRLSLEEDTFNTKSFKINDNCHGVPIPCLVNGDDCLLRGSVKRLRPLWESFCSIAGLYSSLGKTYFSRTFCTINSTIFEWCPTSNRWVESKYINLGLMMGRKRSTASSGNYQSYGMKGHQLGIIARELKRSCPPEWWLRVKSRFIYHNKRVLDIYPGIPWFLPEWLGGYGLPVDFSNEISETDRKAATIIKMLLNHDNDYKPVLPKDMDMWLMHNLVMRNLRNNTRLEPIHYRSAIVGDVCVNFEHHWNKLYKYLTIDLLESTPLEELYQILNKDNSAKKAMFHNVDVHAYARHKIHLLNPEPMNDSDMTFENKDLVIPCFIKDFDSFIELGWGDTTI